MLKKELRRSIKHYETNSHEIEIEEKSLAIANEILKLPIWDKTYFHIFLPIEEQKEVNTEFILHLLSGKDKEIVISKSDFETRNMTHFLLTDNTKIKKTNTIFPNLLMDLKFLPQKLMWFLSRFWLLTKKEIVWVMAKVFMINSYPNANPKPLKLAFLSLNPKN